jgi:Ca2+-binding EF-hand superfamily protein
MGCCGSARKKKSVSFNKSSSSLALNNRNTDEFRPEVSESIINSLLKKTRFTRQDIIDWWNGFLDDCPSGLLDKQKFIEVYEHRYATGKAKKFCNHVFRTFNPDKKTRAINFEQFMCAIDITLNGNSEEKLEWAFTMYDINGDQRISKKEMLTIVDAMFDLLDKNKGKDTPRKHVDQIFARIDTDHDDYISKEEFISGCMRHEEIRAILAPHY